MRFSVLGVALIMAAILVLAVFLTDYYRSTSYQGGSHLALGLAFPGLTQEAERSLVELDDDHLGRRRLDLHLTISSAQSTSSSCVVRGAGVRPLLWNVSARCASICSGLFEGAARATAPSRALPLVARG